MNFHDLHKDVCFSRTNGQIIWQPRIGCWITDKTFGGGQLPTPYTGMEWPDIYRSLGCSARIYEFGHCFPPVYPESVKKTEEEIGPRRLKHATETPVGTVSCVIEAATSGPAALPVKRWIENADDFRIYTWLWENTDWKFDRGIYDKYMDMYSDLGAPTMFMPRVSVQDLYINTMGIEKGILALYDYPQEVGKYFTAMHESHMRLIDVLNDSPVDIINFGDNIHCGTATPEIFKEYVLPYYQERCDKLHAGGKFVSSHWDGDTKSLLPLAKETGLDGIEAITPLPQGDVTLEEVKKHLGDDLFLLDGIPAVMFDKTFTVEQLTETTKRVIDLFAPKLVLGISDEMSSTGDIERIRLINKIVDEYNSQFPEYNK